jgi:GTPase SAR1 family protein
MGQAKSKEQEEQILLIGLPGSGKTHLLDMLEIHKYNIVECNNAEPPKLTYHGIILMVKSSYKEEEMLESKNILLSMCLMYPHIPAYVIETGQTEGKYFNLLQLEALKRPWKVLRALDYNKPEWRYKVLPLLRKQ